MHVTLVDSLMGSGKTTYIMNLMNDAYSEYITEASVNPDTKPPRFLFATPLLTETERVAEGCPNLRFHKPVSVDGKKSEHIKSLVGQGVNIATTHASLERISRDTLSRIHEQGYVLVVDEAPECVRLYQDLTVADRRILLREGLVLVDEETKRLRWRGGDDDAYDGRFVDVKVLCENDSLLMYRDKTILWTMPPHFLMSFAKVYILTYMSHSSPLTAHLRSENIPYDLMTLVDGKLLPWTDFNDEADAKVKLRSLIRLHKGSANVMGNAKGRENPLSSSWFIRQTDAKLSGMKAKLENWFKKSAKTEAKFNGWTTISKRRKLLAGDRYKKGFISLNAKATNDYRHKESMAYVFNVFPNPYLAGYFRDKGVAIDEDIFALSEMLQWIWRSRIRDWKPINLLIPSARMRALFEEWLGSASVAEMIQRREVAKAPRLASEALHDDQLVVIPSAPEIAPEVILEDVPSQAVDEPDSYIPTESSPHGRWVSPTSLLQDLMRSFKPADANAASFEVSNS